MKRTNKSIVVYTDYLKYKLWEAWGNDNEMYFWNLMWGKGVSPGDCMRRMEEGRTIMREVGEE